MIYQLLRDAHEGLLHLFYPRLCEGCRRPLLAAEEVLCIACALQLPETGYHEHPDNEAALRFAGRVPYVAATAYAYFTAEGLLQHLMHGLKYRRRQATGAYLGSRLGAQLAAAGWAADIDAIVPVPLHRRKQAARGYNQSELIARGLGGVLQLPVIPDALVRTRHTDSQTSKTRQERVSNMADAFALNKRYDLKGKHLLLCDDVLTTGATIEACAIALMAEDSIKISIATIGIAVS